MVRAEDLPAIIGLLMDDALGKTRDTLAPRSQQPPAVDPAYQRAFDSILADPEHNEGLIGKHQQTVIATLQLTTIPNLTLKGRKRAQIERVCAWP